MTQIKITPLQTLNKAYLKLPVTIAQIDTMRANFNTLKANAIEGATEENYKNIIADFLKNTWFSNYYINTYDRIDLAIFNSKEANSKPAVLIEVKAPQNKVEMCSLEDLNKKAFHEILLYFLREREQNQNHEIKYLIITNYIEYFLFDAKNFLDNIANDKRVIDLYKKFTAGQLTDERTSTFYNEVALLNLPENNNLQFTHFTLQDFENAFRQNDEQQLIALYKLLSPETLLNIPFANDSNYLNKDFYNELLHIIGLREVTESGQTYIKRLPEKERDYASLIECAIFKMEDLVDDKNQLEDIAMSLVITWVNRLLFLKLLEAQQLAYQNGNKDYRILNINFIKDFDELDDLFFRVLAKNYDDRHIFIKDKYKFVPYANSSLFERTQLEREYIPISQLSQYELKLYHNTVLKDSKHNKREGKLFNLQYIFEFLDAYNFASDGNSTIQKESKTLINASVLGLIFEKLNGYKDGSFFTPGFITQYMAHEAISRAVVQKFNTAKGWHCQTLTDVKNEIEDRKEAANIFNTIKICDPAVGSGHFLVSALNELIATKSYLGLLYAPDGTRIKAEDWQITVENDELSISDDNNKLYTYNHLNAANRLVQEALFNEKRNLIENCLFGVDINPNSVNICRLRLWIELLKNAYYTKDSNYTELETLPNIDINIKTGNSLISKIPVHVNDSRLSIAHNPKFRTLISEYKTAVNDYKREKDKYQKDKLTKLITQIKAQFAESIQLSFLDDDQDKKLKNDSNYNNSLEWMIEFPEVMDEYGKFMGFDVVIGNPPYISIQDIKEEDRKRYKSLYNFFYHRYDLFACFIERALSLLATNGIMSFIQPSVFLNSKSFMYCRKYLVEEKTIQRLHLLKDGVFASAVVPTMLMQVQNNKAENNKIICSQGIQKNTHIYTIDQDIFKTTTANVFNLSLDNTAAAFIQKTEQNCLMLGDIARVSNGINTGDLSKYITTKPKKGYIPILKGSAVKKWTFTFQNHYLKDCKDQFVSCGDMESMKSEKLMMMRIGIYPTVCYDNTGIACLHTLHTIRITDKMFSPKYIMGLLNSKLLGYIFRLRVPLKGNVFPEFRIFDLNQQMPIKNISPAQQLPIITLVDKILAAKQANPQADTTELEMQIDKAVYELYGLTEEEIAIIEK